jgi:type II secretion system protein N
MIIFRNILYIVLVIAVFILLFWFFAIPDDLIREKIEESVSGLNNQEIRVSMDEIKKGLFFSVHSKNVQLKIGDKPALTVTELTARINPIYFIRKQLTFSIEGRMGSGHVNGSLRFPGGGSLRINDAELDSIPYLQSLGIKSTGYISAHIIIRDNTAKVVFEIPDLNIQEYNKIESPLLATFHTVQGVLNIVNDKIRIDSLGLEGDKGYARIKGDITAGFMDLTLELMPSAGELSQAEIMLIDSYLQSPGYYVIPLKYHL